MISDNKSNVLAYGAKSLKGKIEELSILRRDCDTHDIEIEIDYCGICHSDIHMVNNDWGFSTYPLVPGHEIVGHVSKVGPDVTKFKVGDCVGVGCLVDSCGDCGACRDHEEPYCEKGGTWTYGSFDKKHDEITYGGYSKKIVVSENFVLKIPSNLDLGAVAPLLCAGVTTWSPLKHWNIQKNDLVGVVGLGGLGHMGVKFAKAMGAKVVVISRTLGKKEAALELGADEILISTDLEEMKKHENKFDFILNTVPHKHDVNPYLALLKRNKTMVVVGAIDFLEEIHGGILINGRKSIAGSLIGGIKETQEMLDFCGQHKITSMVEVIGPNQINEAYKRMQNSDVKYRFVIDMKK